MMKNHRTLDDFHSGPMKKNERWMKIIQRWKKKTQRSTNFHQLLRLQRAPTGSFHGVVHRIDALPRFRHRA
jgi:hypothetical protein